MAGKDLISLFKIAVPDGPWVLAQILHGGEWALLKNRVKFKDTEYGEHCRGSAQTCAGWPFPALAPTRSNRALKSNTQAILLLQLLFEDLWPGDNVGVGVGVGIVIVIATLEFPLVALLL